MNCPRCNARLEHGDRFCPICGSDISSTQQQTRAHSASSPTPSLPLEIVNYMPLVAYTWMSIAYDFISAATHFGDTVLNTGFDVLSTVVYLVFTFQNIEAAKPYVDEARKSAMQQYFMASVVLSIIGFVATEFVTASDVTQGLLGLGLITAYLSFLGWRDKLFMNNWWGFSPVARMSLLQLALDVVWMFAF